MSRLRIALDGRALASPAGGVRRYASELLKALVDSEPDLSLVLVGGDPQPDSPMVRTLPVTWSPPTNVGWTLAALPLAARRIPYDVFHAPAYTAPLWGVRPLVVTIHDVSYARHPEWYPYRIDPFRRWFYRRSAQVADLVITDSDFSRGEIAAAYGIDRERIVVVPLGVGWPFRPGPSVDLRSSPGLDVPFVLHVGDLHARRNLSTALAAVCEVRGRRSDARQLRLVLAGVDRGEADRLRIEAAAAGHGSALAFVSSPTDATLVALYRTAAALVYPSRYEGFGLPVLEAMACGLPVVASRAGALPELTGSAAMLVEPDDVRGFAAAIEQVVFGRERGAEMRSASLARAGLFSWARTAAATADVYRRATRRNRDDLSAAP